MPRFDNEVRITPSVLDRLIDYEPEMSQEAIASRSKSLRQLKQSVRRDLEWLLNTRQKADGLPSDLHEIHNSVLAYGLPDFTAVRTKSPAEQTRLRRSIETAISTFEPRLEGVKVTLEPMRDTERVMRFRIEGLLKIDPAPEAVTFDTLMDPALGQYILKEL